MVIVSSYYEASCQLRQRARPTLIVAILSERAGALYEDSESNLEEGVGYGRSVWPESPGLHAAHNGWDNGSLTRKGTVIP